MISKAWIGPKEKEKEKTKIPTSCNGIFTLQPSH